MVKNDIVKMVSQKTSFEPNAVEEIINATLDVIRQSVKSGNKVHLRRFGSFVLKHRKSKLVRDINRNRPFRIPARNVPAFIPSKSNFNVV